ncbi:MAG: hypothetical protein R3F53_26760 [Gammaproteobacteria bacterium]
MVEVEWNELVFSSADNLLQQLEKIAHKRFPDDQQLADQAFNEALATLSANNWQILKAYQGKSSPKGYLIVTFRNTIEDYARKRFGRLRPPEDVKRKGAVWLEIYNRLVLEKQLEPTIIDAIIAQTALSAADVQNVIRTIKQLTTQKPEMGLLIKTIRLWKICRARLLTIRITLLSDVLYWNVLDISWPAY